jgi:acyl-CoA thioester hydrolase
MQAPYQKNWSIRSSDFDFNGHVKSAAYLTLAIDTRLAFFSEQGFPLDEFRRLNIGPVTRQDIIVYRREIRAAEMLRVNLQLAGLGKDGSFTLRNELFLEASELPRVTITSHAVWIDLAARKMILPPEQIVIALQRLPKTTDFQAKDYLGLGPDAPELIGLENQPARKQEEILESYDRDDVPGPGGQLWV